MRPIAHIYLGYVAQLIPYTTNILTKSYINLTLSVLTLTEVHSCMQIYSLKQLNSLGYRDIKGYKISVFIREL